MAFMGVIGVDWNDPHQSISDGRGSATYIKAPIGLWKIQQVEGTMEEEGSF